MEVQFHKYKEELYDILLGEHPNKEFDLFCNKLSEENCTSAMIYELFVQFHQDIQTNPSTKSNEDLYDLLSDYMDSLVN